MRGVMVFQASQLHAVLWRELPSKRLKRNHRGGCTPVACQLANNDQPGTWLYSKHHHSKMDALDVQTA